MTRWRHDENYRARHRLAKQKWSRKNNKEINKLLHEFRKEGCRNCGELHPATLVAHHLDPSAKDYAVSQMRNHNWQKVRAELEKCVCLCCNCHSKLHAGEDIRT